MRERGAGQRRQRASAARGGVVEPGDEAFHFARYACGRGCLEMDPALVDCTGDHLHRIRVRPISADYVNLAVSGQQHRVPVEHRLVRQRRCVVPIEIDHHLGDAALGGTHAGAFRREAKLFAQGGLHAIAVEDFPFDRRGLDGLLADQLDRESRLVVMANVLADPEELPGLPQKLLLQRLQALGIVSEMWPARLFPVPGHDLYKISIIAHNARNFEL